MEPFHERLAQVGLAALERYGFVLAGGYVFQLHDVTTRLSQDVDLFTDQFDADLFSQAEQAILDAYRQQGWTATVGKKLDVFRQIEVTDPVTGSAAIVDLGFDSREHPPVRFHVGPVLSLEDAAVSKVRTLIDREAARDFIDIHELLAGEHFGGAELVRLASGADPNVTPEALATALEHSALPEPEDYAAYGLTLEDQQSLHARLAAGARELRSSAPSNVTKSQRRAGRSRRQESPGPLQPSHKPEPPNDSPSREI